MRRASGFRCAKITRFFFCFVCHNEEKSTLRIFIPEQNTENNEWFYYSENECSPNDIELQSARGDTDHLSILCATGINERTDDDFNF